MDCSEECGIFGVWAPSEPVLGICYAGIFSLQHRGQEGAGIALYDGKSIHIQTGLGLVSDVFKNLDLTRCGQCAIGHVQYSKRGGRSESNLLPLSIDLPQGTVAISFNGKLTNYDTLRTCLEANGVKFNTASDAEVILHLLSETHCSSLEEMVSTATKRLEGSYSILLMTNTQLIAVRDPSARKPLCLGKLKEGQFVVASESCAIGAVNAQFIRDLSPGEILIIDAMGIRTISMGVLKQQQRCVFEYIYLARPDSVMDNIDVWMARYRMGKQLAKEHLFEADIVVPVPSSGTVAATGYSEQSGIPLVEGIIKNGYAGRTFILPSQEKREAMVSLKLAPIKNNIKGKNILLVDDSVVRGTTMRYLISMLRQCEVKKIFLCLSSPQIFTPCNYGVDMATHSELISSQLSLEEIRESLGCDGIHFLSINGLMEAVDDVNQEVMCLECFRHS